MRPLLAVLILIFACVPVDVVPALPDANYYVIEVDNQFKMDARVRVLEGGSHVETVRVVSFTKEYARRRWTPYEVSFRIEYLGSWQVNVVEGLLVTPMDTIELTIMPNPKLTFPVKR